MVPFRVRSKKPRDNIKEKTPDKEKESFITVKTPDDSNDQFSLPPSRKKEEIPKYKENVTYPTNHGLKEKKQEDKNSRNKLPPASEPQKQNEDKIPTSKGIIPKSQRKKEPINKTAPIKVKKPKEQNRLLPSSRGVTNKKPTRIINKKPEQSIHSKIPESKQIPLPSTLAIKKKNLKGITSKTPPKSQPTNDSKKIKSIPPTLIKTKIPKTKIKDKKPI